MTESEMKLINEIVDQYDHLTAMTVLTYMIVDMTVTWIIAIETAITLP